MARRYNCALDHTLRVVFAVIFLSGIAAPTWAQFETRAVQKMPFGAFSAVAGDFNNDGILDIAVNDDNGFSVSLGKGDGTFREPTVYGATGLQIAIGDFNGDNNLDVIATTVDASLSLYLGNGDGTFQPAITIPTTAQCGFVRVGDFNGDGKLDVVVVDGAYISVLLGNGDGTFQRPIDNNSFLGPGSLAVGDFNNDHKLDVVVVGSFGGGANIGVLLGNGDGTLQNSLTLPLAKIPAYVSVGDFNRDGNLDVVVGGEFNGLTVLLGNGRGGFGPAVTYQAGGGLPTVVADLNLDGKLDLAVASGNGIDVLWGIGDGRFELPKFFATEFSGLPVVGDFNGDHRLDLVLANEDSIVTVLNTGVVIFSPTAPLEFGKQQVGTSSPMRSVTITNNGKIALSIRSIRVSGEFGVTDDCGNSVAAGARCKMRVVFQPTTAGPQNGLINIVDGASSKPQVIDLSGDGVQSH